MSSSNRLDYCIFEVFSNVSKPLISRHRSHNFNSTKGGMGHPVSGRNIVASSLSTRPSFAGLEFRRRRQGLVLVDTDTV